MPKADFWEKSLPEEQGTIMSAELMTRLNNQVPTGEDFDGSAPLLYAEAYGTANAYSVDLVFGKIVSERVNTQLQTNRLFDINATFQADGVEARDTALNVSDRTSATVVSVDDENTLTLDSHIFPTDGKKYAVGPHIFQAPEALAEGMEIAFIAADANTGASTLSVNSLPPVPIRKQGDVDLAYWDIRAGQVVKVVYDGTCFQMLNPGKPWYLLELILSNWTERYTPASYLRGIAWNGSLFCAVGDADATDAYILTSPNGITWTERNNPKATDLQAIAWNGSLFCAVGRSDGTLPYIVTSPDGIAWTERTAPKNAELSDIAWNGSVFCAVGYADGTDAYILTSPDGVTWTERSNPKNAGLRSITWNGSLFCAVGDNDGTDTYIVTSPDGVTWTEQGAPASIPLFDIAWNGSVFCAMSMTPHAPTITYILTSPDGVTWTQQNAPLLWPFGIAWSGFAFCAVGGAMGNTSIMTSPDGVTWTERFPTNLSALYDVAWNGSMFCAVGQTILTSLSL